MTPSVGVSLHLLAALSVAACFPGSVLAQSYPQGYAAPSQQAPQTYQQPRSSPVVETVGSFVKRLFYGEPQPAQASRQQGRFAGRSGRNLDAPPSVYNRLAAAHSNPATEPAPAPTPPKPPETSRPASAETKPPAVTESKPAASSSTPKYTPPKIQSTPPASKPQSAPPPQPQVKVQESPPPPAPVEPVVNQASAEPPPPPVTTQPPADAPVTLSNLGGSLPGTTTTPPAPQPSTTTPPKEPAPPTTQSTVGSSQFLVGKKTGVPGRVLSPYPPYQELDVTGLASGSLALDPTTDKVFEIP